MHRSEIKPLLIGLAISPLSLAVFIPCLLWIEQIVDHEPVSWRMIGAVPIALIFGYLGMVIFGLPLYGAIRAVRRWPMVSATIAAFIGVFAAFVVPQLLELVRSPDIALQNLIIISQDPSYWIGAPALSGGAVGVTFWYLTIKRTRTLNELA